MNETNKPVGIDHMALYVPDPYLSLDDLAAARGVDPNKYFVGIGIRETAIATPAEDVVVLAANAGHRVLEEADVSPDDIGLLIVGTESAEDKSKPTATHVHELLGINSACRVYDVVHACAGATYGVLSAIDWLHNPAHKYALVIASDIARYGKNEAGEPTQGAGAVAMLLCRSPRLLALGEIATFSKNVYDFWKPLDQKYPLVDGIYSARCYGEAAEACFGGQDLAKDAAYIYHAPYPKLVQQTHGQVARMIDGNVDAKSHFKDQVAPSLRFAARIGNIYTGSMWLALMSFLEAQRSDGGDAADGCYLFSYGSGCGAALLRGTFPPNWQAGAALFGTDAALDSRTRLGFDEYETLMDIYENPESISADKLAATAVGGAFRYLGTEKNKRRYGKA